MKKPIVEMTNDIPAPPPVKSKKKTILSTLFLLLLCGVGVYIMAQLAESFADGDAQTLAQVIANMDWTYFILAIITLLVMITADVLKYWVVSKVTTSKAKIGTCTKVALLGKYYDNITPFAIGGQPFQIHYLHKRGYTGGQASAVVMIKWFAQMFCWSIVAFSLMLFNRQAISGIDNALLVTIKVGAWIGFAFNALPWIGALLLIIMPKLTDKVLCFVVKIGFKLRIIKDQQKYIDKAHKVATDFVQCFAIMKTKPLYFIALMLLCFIEPIAMLSFPYFLVVSLANQTASLTLWITVITLNMFAMYSVAILPTPGNSGGYETTFSLLFGVIASNVLFWVTFSWRFFTYYIYILIGFVITIGTFIRDAVRARKARLASVNDTAVPPQPTTADNVDVADNCQSQQNVPDCDGTIDNNNDSNTTDQSKDDTTTSDNDAN